MGLFDDLAKNVMGQLGGGPSGGDSPLLGMALQFLQNNPGGLNGLLDQLRGAGLGKEVQSWISTGSNLPVSPDQLTRALGGDKLGSIASQLGMGQADVSGQLANLLPQLVDKLSPQGSLPPQDALQEGLGKLMGMFGK